ncbi:MAG: hypothetical protein WEE89_03930 [Gemmatimonadota bacterium]
MKAKGLLTLMAAASLAGCGAAQQLDDVLGAVLAPQGNNQVSGEVLAVDTRNQQIQIRTAEGQTGYVNYDANTRVVYNNQQYNVTSLERGDLVSMTVQTVNTNQVYTNEITVTQSAQDRAGTSTGTSGLQRLEGTIGLIDRNRGTFELRSGGTTVVVSLAYNATSAVRDRYSRIRSGDVVRLEGRWVGQNNLQVERFL